MMPDNNFPDRERDINDLRTRAGELAHAAITRLVWRHYQAAFCEWQVASNKDWVDEIDQVIFNRFDSRLCVLEVLLDELLEQCLVNEWPIPTEIAIIRQDVAAEGQ